jgi:hypothetical protein
MGKIKFTKKKKKRIEEDGVGTLQTPPVKKIHKGFSEKIENIEIYIIYGGAKN